MNATALALQGRREIFVNGRKMALFYTMPKNIGQYIVLW